MNRLVTVLVAVIGTLLIPSAALALSAPTAIPSDAKGGLRIELDDEDPGARVTGSGFSCTLAISELTEDFDTDEDRATGCQQFFTSLSGGSITLVARPSPGFVVGSWESVSLSAPVPACDINPGEGGAAPTTIRIPRSQLEFGGNGSTPACYVDLEPAPEPPDPCVNPRLRAPAVSGDVCIEEPACPAGAIVGTDDGETIEGTEGDDVICALAATTRSSGRGGNDLILGGAGSTSHRGGTRRRSRLRRHRRRSSSAGWERHDRAARAPRWPTVAAGRTRSSPARCWRGSVAPSAAAATTGCSRTRTPRPRGRSGTP
ncbi:MAG: hypothetical protein R3C15_16015 [Thermoleophilia bacterium]